MWRTSKGIGTNSENWCLAKQPNNIAISDRPSGFPIRLRNSYLPSQKQTTGGKQIPETSVTSKQHTLPQATDHVNFCYSVRKFLLDLSQINNKTKENSQNSRLPYHNLTISSVATKQLESISLSRLVFSMVDRTSKERETRKTWLYRNQAALTRSKKANETEFEKLADQEEGRFPITDRDDLFRQSDEQAALCSRWLTSIIPLGPDTVAPPASPLRVSWRNISTARLARIKANQRPCWVQAAVKPALQPPLFSLRSSVVSFLLHLPFRSACVCTLVQRSPPPRPGRPRG